MRQNNEIQEGDAERETPGMTSRGKCNKSQGGSKQEWRRQSEAKEREREVKFISKEYKREQWYEM